MANSGTLSSFLNFECWIEHAIPTHGDLYLFSSNDNTVLNAIVDYQFDHSVEFIRFTNRLKI